MIPSSQLRRIVIILSVAVGILAWLQFGYEVNAGSHRLSIEHVESAADEVASNFSSVDIALERPAGIPVLSADVFAPGWTDVNDGRFRSGPDAEPLTFAGPMSAETNIQWQTGGGGGTIVVLLDGESIEEVRATAADSGTIEVELSESLPWTALLLLAAFIGWSVSGGVFLLGRFGAATESLTPKPTLRAAVEYARFPLAVWVTLLIIFWPGMMNPDSVTQWDQLERGQLSDWHPYPMNIALGVGRWVVDSPWLPILFVAAATAFLVGVAASWAERSGAPRWCVRAIMIAPALSPVTSIMTVSLWKDVAMGVGVLALVLVLWRTEDSDGAWLRTSRRNVTFAVVACLTIWLTRHNGWPIVVGSLLAMALFRPQARRGLVLVGGITLAVAFVVRVPMMGLLDVEPSPVTSMAYVQRISAHVNSGTELEPSEHEFLEALRPLDVPWPYDCRTVQTTWFGSDVIPFDEYRNDEPRLRNLVAKLTLRNPDVELAHLKCSSRIVWQISERGTYTYFLDGYSHGGFVNSIPLGRGDFPMEEHPSNSLAVNVYEWYVGLPSGFIRPALYLYLLAGATAAAALRRRSVGPVLIVMPAFVQIATVVPFALVQDTRFLYGAILVSMVATPALLANAFASAASEPADDSRQVPDTESVAGPGVPNDAERSV